MKVFEWDRHSRRKDRPVSWHYWPISIGWFRRGCTAFICWHGWPIAGSGIYPDATFKDCGWTIHIGALKVYFGRR